MRACTSQRSYDTVADIGRDPPSRPACTVAIMTAIVPLNDLVTAAVHTLSGERWAITGAGGRVPARPGLYAIYGDDQTWARLALEAAFGRPLFVGKAEDSLVSRDPNGHFAMNPRSKPQTGSSTVRRSFAALLRASLQLEAVPRNLANPERFANYALAPGGDERLTLWMHTRLTLAAWPVPVCMPVPLKEVETAVIEHLTPPLNIDKNPRRLARLSRARAEMAAEASRWRPT